MTSVCYLAQLPSVASQLMHSSLEDPELQRRGSPKHFPSFLVREGDWTGPVPAGVGARLGVRNSSGTPHALCAFSIVAEYRLV